MRVNKAIPQSLDMPASTTISTNMKTDTIITNLSFTMRFTPKIYTDDQLYRLTESNQQFDYALHNIPLCALMNAAAAKIETSLNHLPSIRAGIRIQLDCN